MLTLHTAYDVQIDLRNFICKLRKKNKLSVKALSTCSGVPYGTIRKFENTGNISLRQFLMLYEAVGDLKKFHALTSHNENEPTSIDEVLKNA